MVVVVVVVVVGVGAGTTGAIVATVVVPLGGVVEAGGAVVVVAVVSVGDDSTVGSVCVWSRPGFGGAGVDVEVVVVVVGGGVVDATSVVVCETVFLWSFRLLFAFSVEAELRVGSAATTDADAPPELLLEPPPVAL